METTVEDEITVEYHYSESDAQVKQTPEFRTTYFHI